MARTLIIKKRDHALIVGYLGIVIGSYALWEAYEVRGKSRPFLMKFLPGA
jgi:hypothetical protein